MLWGETSQGMVDKKKQKSYVAHSEKKKDVTENYEEIRTGGETANPDSEVEEEGEMEELAGFNAVIYRWYRLRQRQQVVIGTSSDSEIKAEKKKAWLYLGRMARGTMVERVKRFLNGKGIKLQLTENLDFWPQGAVVCII
jgi:hypothetical protein